MPKRNKPRSPAPKDQSDLFYPEDLLPEEQGLEDADWLPGGAEDYLIPQGLVKKLLRKGLGRMMAKEAAGSGIKTGQKKAIDKLLKRGDAEPGTRGTTRGKSKLSQAEKDARTRAAHEKIAQERQKIRAEESAARNKPEYVIDYGKKDRLGFEMPKKPKKADPDRSY